MATTTGYICQCSFPFTGSNCETLITTPAPIPFCACVVCPCPQPVVTIVNPCLPNPCQNNGGCAVVQNLARCYCPTSYSGYYCQFGKWLVSPVTSLILISTFSARKRTLSNAACANVTCANGGECVVSEKGAQCTCPTPYYGDRCEMSKPSTRLEERLNRFLPPSQPTTNMQSKPMR